MAIINASRFKIALAPDSVKVQGLRVGDIALRKYYDNTTQYYSLLLVEEIGSSIDGDFFVGKLLDGMEPGSTGDELLDFVRVTNLFDVDRMGALYMTSSESNSPYLDIIDALGKEAAVSFPEGVQQNGGYYNNGVPIYGSVSYQDENRTFRITRNNQSVVNYWDFASIIKVQGEMIAGENYIISYKYRANKDFSLSSTLANSVNSDINLSLVSNFTDTWQYANTLFSCSFSEDEAIFQTFLGTQIKDGDWIEFSDFSIIPVSSLINRTSDIKVRLGKLSGVKDKTFGELSGYGGYLQKLYATKDAHIAGTLIAGDKDGFGASFYAGKIAKNLFPNSINLDTFLSLDANWVSNGLTSDIFGDTTALSLSKSILGDSSVYKLLSNLEPDTKYTFSFWVKSDASQQIEILIRDIQNANDVYKSVDANTEWARHFITITTGENISTGGVIVGFKSAAIISNISTCGWQVETGDGATLYQATDGYLSEDGGYGMWFAKGGFGGTMQHPIMKFDEHGNIIGGDNKLILRPDGSAEFNGDLVIKNSAGEDMNIEEAIDEAKTSAIDTANTNTTDSISSSMEALKTSYLGALARLDSVGGGHIDNNSIELAKLGTTLISGGLIRTDLLDADKIKADIINATYIEGGAFNFIKGSVGGWNLDSGKISAFNIELDASGAIKQTEGKWGLNSDGSGQFASGKISFNAVGDVEFAEDVKLQWGNIDNISGLKPLIFNSSEVAAWPVNTDFDGGLKYNVTVLKDSSGLIKIRLGGAEGGVHVGLNGVDLGVFNNNGVSAIWHSLDVDFIEGDNVISIWAENSDGGSVNQILVYGEGEAKYLTQIDSNGAYIGSLTANQIKASIIDTDKLTAEHVDVASIKANFIGVNKIDAINIKTDEITSIGLITAGSFDINSKFKVSNLGVMEAVEAKISGEIVATSGKIGGVVIDNGDMIVSDSATITDIISSGVYFEETPPFKVGDKLRCQQLAADNTSLNVYYIIVTSVGENSLGHYIQYANKTGAGTPKVGDLLTRWSGGLLYLNSSDEVNGAYLDVLSDGVTKTRLGNLTGINDPVFGQLSGQGLYSENFYGRGDIILGNNSSIDFANVNNSPNMVGINLRKLSDYQAWEDKYSASQEILNDREIKINIGTFYTHIGGGGSYNNLFPNIDFKPDTQYTFSGEMKNTVSNHNGLNMRAYYTDGEVETIFADYYGTGVYRPFKFTSAKGKSIAKISCSYWSGGYQWLKDFKIEKGTVATDWSLAPEDITGRLTHIDANGIYSGQAVLGGWSINENSIYSDRDNGRVEFVNDAEYPRIRVSDKTNANRVQMYYFSGTDYGVTAYKDSKLLFRLGSTNKIGGWNFDNESIWTGVKNNTDSYSTSGISINSRGSITSKNFVLQADGDAFFRGSIEAASGKIGEFAINSSTLIGTHLGDTVILDPNLGLKLNNKNGYSLDITSGATLPSSFLGGKHSRINTAGFVFGGLTSATGLGCVLDIQNSTVLDVLGDVNISEDLTVKSVNGVKTVTGYFTSTTDDWQTITVPGLTQIYGVSLVRNTLSNYAPLKREIRVSGNTFGYNRDNGIDGNVNMRYVAWGH